MTRCILSSAYAPPVEWIQKARRYDEVWVEDCDNYQKQTYRNRCVIATSQGLQTLNVPVVHAASRLGRDTMLSDHGHWQHLHWQALCSAYGLSPYFEHYADSIRPFYDHTWPRLYDFNLSLTLVICRLLGFSPAIKKTTEYIAPGQLPARTDDFRDVIRPKHPLPDPTFRPRPYWQMHAHERGFQPNLSIFDLLFCEGPEGIMWL